MAKSKPTTCRGCGAALPAEARFCRRCGLTVGAPAPETVEHLQIECPICYTKSDTMGRFPEPGGYRPVQNYNEHVITHDQHPVGDDDYLESLRDDDQIRIGRWKAPFDLVRRYLVTGQWDGGHSRAYQHNAVVYAMVGLSRNPNALPPAAKLKEEGGILGRLRRKQADETPDPDAIAEARALVTQLMERYHRRRY